jgi:hypothetical protein
MCPSPHHAGCFVLGTHLTQSNFHPYHVPRSFRVHPALCFAALAFACRARSWAQSPLTRSRPTSHSLNLNPIMEQPWTCCVSCFCVVILSGMGRSTLFLLIFLSAPLW